ncbi:MAG TPA: hypothetical protein VN776_08075 [Terracidiphilus sp.]|nr:hypothetical protein [Terracidiphilus sp.]
MRNIEESTKIAREARLATLGRAIADQITRSAPVMPLVQEAAILRASEQERASRETRFAGLVRQLGDAHNAGQDCKAIMAQLIDLRRAELGPAHSS